MVHKVLITGANGFIGSHVLEKLLLHGYSVRGIVRSQSKADQVAADFPKYGAQLDFGIVPDLMALGSFDEVVKSTPPFDTVIHTASPFLYRAVEDSSEFLEPAIKGTLEVLKSVKAHAPNVKRVIVTSSFAAIVDSNASAPATVKKVYTEDDWNSVTLGQAIAGPLSRAYQASKKYAEKAAWDFIKDEKPNFELVTLNPPMVYGPLRHTIRGMDDLNESNSRIYKLFINSSKDAELPPNGLPLYVDVRDVAEAHILAATVEEASNSRFIISPGQIRSQEISDILRGNLPELESRTPEGVPRGNPLPDNFYTVSSARAQKILGLKFRSKEETFVDLARQLLEIEKQK